MLSNSWKIGRRSRRWKEEVGRFQDLSLIRHGLAALMLGENSTTDRHRASSKSKKDPRERKRESERVKRETVTRWIGKLMRLHPLRQIDLLDKDWVTELESRSSTIVASNLTPSSSDNLVIINRSWNGTPRIMYRFFHRQDFLRHILIWFLELKIKIQFLFFNSCNNTTKKINILF